MSELRGDRVLLERRRLNMKQETLASIVGVNRSYISQIERGSDVNIGVKTLAAIADALGVSMVYLLGESESPLAEPDSTVLREMSGEYVTWDVDTEEERRRVRSLLALYGALPAATQEIAIEMVRLLRAAVAPAPEPVEPPMDEAEWQMWTRLLDRFDEPTRRAIEASVGKNRQAAGAGEASSL